MERKDFPLTVAKTSRGAGVGDTRGAHLHAPSRVVKQPFDVCMECRTEPTM